MACNKSSEMTQRLISAKTPEGVLFGRYTVRKYLHMCSLKTPANLRKLRMCTYLLIDMLMLGLGLMLRLVLGF